MSNCAIPTYPPSYLIFVFEARRVALRKLLFGKMDKLCGPGALWHPGRRRWHLMGASLSCLCSSDVVLMAERSVEEVTDVDNMAVAALDNEQAATHSVAPPEGMLSGYIGDEGSPTAGAEDYPDTPDSTG